MPIDGEMSYLRAGVRLHDIEDVDRYVGGVIRNRFVRCSSSEREELELEGLAILYELEQRWNGCDSFRGFASSRLGFRLIDARRRLNRGSRMAGGPPLVLSWDALAETEA